jgi:hypothetical protein
MTRDMKIGIIIGMILVEPYPDRDPSIKELMRVWQLTNADVLNTEARKEITDILEESLLTPNGPKERGQ